MLERNTIKPLVSTNAHWKELDAYAYNGDDLGAVYSENSTTFKVWAPTASQVKVCLFTKGSDGEEGSEYIKDVDMVRDDETAVWSVEVGGDLNDH